MQFLYKSRQRAEQAFVGGKSFIRDKILSSINIIGNGLGYRNYNLNHDTSSLGYERLRSITKKVEMERKATILQFLIMKRALQKLE